MRKSWTSPPRLAVSQYPAMPPSLNSPDWTTAFFSFTSVVNNQSVFDCRYALYSSTVVAVVSLVPPHDTVNTGRSDGARESSLEYISLGWFMLVVLPSPSLW